MLADFWKAAGGKLADRWAAVSIPALIFWLGGLAAWTYHRGGLSAPNYVAVVFDVRIAGQRPRMDIPVDWISETELAVATGVAQPIHMAGE